MLIYGIPTLIATIVSLLRGSIILPYILGLVVILDFSLFAEYVRLRKLLERLRKILVGDDPVDKETKEILKDSWPLILYTVIAFIIIFLIALSP